TDELRALGRTNYEAEFLTLDYGAARDRIERGLRLLRGCGLSPVGFVPPAWLARRECGVAVSDSGLSISEDESSVTLHARGTRLPSPVVRWSTRTPWRARAGAIVARTSRLRHDNDWLVRIALHPRDIEHSPTWESVRQTMESWLTVRTPWRYGAL
ncbi:MAG: DUF2334 domain-containing protein, partial [bacterium]